MRSLPFTVDRVAMRVAAKHADDIRNGLRSSINISQIVDSFLATYPDGVVTRAQARDWARLNVITNNVRLGRALEALYASGWVLGTDYGSEAMRLAAIKKAPTFTIDWSKWKPGQPAAEALVRPPRGLRRLLAKFRNQTIKGISDTNLDRIGTVLADGLAVGADSRSVARELMELGIRGIVDDARRALTIAITETSRAVGAATLERYQEMGLRRFEWITVEGEGVCEACDENADAGPIPVGEEFPSGDLHEPAHPNCRCKMAPFIEGFSTPVREMAELGATADAVKYDDDQPRDERGRFSTESGGDALDQSEANQQIWNEGVNRVLGVKEGQIPGYAKGVPQELKAAVTANIAEKLSNLDVRQLADLALTGPTQVQYVALALSDTAGIEGQQYFVGLDQGGSLDVRTNEYEGFVSPGTPEAEEMVRSAAVSAMVQQWALTSNNEDYRSLAIQEVAAQTFGIQDHADWHIREGTTERMNGLIAEHGDVLRAFVTAQYDATQEYLKSAGITSIELYRGMNVSDELYRTIADEDYGQHELETRPLTSWSTAMGTALDFATGRNGVLLRATIPADRIFSLPLTGFGCLNEKEVVVLGGRDTVIASTAQVARNW